MGNKSCTAERISHYTALALASRAAAKPGREGESDGAVHWSAGPVGDGLPGICLLQQPAGDPREDSSVGIRPADFAGIVRAEISVGCANAGRGRRRGEEIPGIFVRGIFNRIRPAGQKGFAAGADICVSGAAHDYFYRRFFFGAVPLRNHAVYYPPGCAGDDGDNGYQWRGIAERGGKYFHGPDGSAADHTALSAAAHALGADDGDDLRIRARFRRHYGRGHSLWYR